MDRFDYVVVGAGLSGAVCAERLASAGKRVLVIEARDHVGGNAHDRYNEHGILVHQYGAHIFHTNAEAVWTYLSRFTTWRPYVHRVRTRARAGLLPFPINRDTLAAYNGDLDAAIAELVTPYTTKQWGPYAADLDAGVLHRVRPRDSHDDRYFEDRYQGLPRDGYTALFHRLLQRPGVTLLLRTRWADVRAGLRSQLDAAAGVIWTGPIDAFFDYRLGRLPYRSATFHFATFPEPRVLPAGVGVVNIPDPEVSWTRACEFTQLTGQRHPWTTVGLETPSATGDPYWPVPTSASAALARQYRELARTEPRVRFCGRLGSYQYLNMDQAVAQALKLSEQLLAGAPAPC